MRLIVAVFVLGENMVVHGKEKFVEGGFVNFKEQGFKDF